MFSNLFSITLPNIKKYFPEIHFPRNSLSTKKKKKKTTFHEQTVLGVSHFLRELLQLAFQSPSKSKPFSSHGTHPCQSLLQGKRK